MKDSMTKKVLTGRPFGGTGFIWNKQLSNSVKPRIDYQHERVTVLEISDRHHNILCINVYLPYHKTSNADEQIALFNNTIGYIDYVIASNPGYEFILLGDSNCNIFNSSHPYTPAIKNLISRWRLFCSYNLINSFNPFTMYTRRDFKATSNNSLLDYVFISEDLKDICSNTTVNHFADNTSDHLPVSVDIELDITITNVKKTNNHSSSINWASIDHDTKQKYSDSLKSNLDTIVVPIRSLIHGNHCCDDTDHIFSIEKYFSDIIDAICKADKCLPRSKPGISRDFWTPELTELKTASYDAFIIWRDVGKPSSGPIFDLKKKANARYKFAVRKAKNTFDQSRSDAIHSNLVNGNNNRFWKSWQELHGKKSDVPTRVNGKTDSNDIANEFAANFKRIYDDASTEQASCLSDNFNLLYSEYSSSHINDDLSPNYLSWDNMVSVMSMLKPGKASGSFIKAEHILHGCPQLTIHLHLLFNAIIQHGYVPSDFLRGVVSPIIKDTEGDSSSLDNYRGITLSHIFSYLFEHAVLLKIDPLMLTDDLQFGYKKSHSTSHAIYTMKRCIDYFNDHGSHVYASFLDCTKGFDRVSHHGLFTKLIHRKIPLCFLRVLIYWYSNLFSVVKWENCISDNFRVISGVRQGGVLSAKFWAIYMDDLIILLKKSHKGCFLADLFLACILYANDVCLLAPSRTAMQKLLDICSDYAQQWCIKYNERKTKLMYFGKNPDSFTCHPLFLNGQPLEFVSEWKYLGVSLQSGSGFFCSAQKPRSAFYRSSNSILNALRGPSNDVQMKLLYSVCVPNITYACDVAVYSQKDKESLHVAVNDAIRKIYSYNRWESIRALRIEKGYLSVTEIFANRKSSFERNLSQIGNTLLTNLSCI